MEKIWENSCDSNDDENSISNGNEEDKDNPYIKRKSLFSNSSFDLKFKSESSPIFFYSNSSNNYNFDLSGFENKNDDLDISRIKSSKNINSDFTNVYFKEFHSTENKTNEVTRIKGKEMKNINEIIVEPKSPEINKEFRSDNKKIKIKRAICNLFLQQANEKIKDENLKIRGLDTNKVQDINILKNKSLGGSKWKDIILENSKGNDEIIKKIYEKNEKDAIKLLEMTFHTYLEIFKENILAQFLEKEKKSQIKKYKQKKYKEIIKKEISEKNIENLTHLKKFVTLGVKNKNYKNKLNFNKNEENIIQEFEGRNYKISKENKFIKYIKSSKKYKNINFELTSKEINDINKNIEDLKALVNDFQNWFNKTPRKSRKKKAKIFSIKKSK